MITETSGFSYLGTDCGYKWTPSTERGLAEGASPGKPIAVIIDGQIVATFTTYPPIWEALQAGTIVDVSAANSIPEGEAAMDIVVGGSTAYTLHISNELLAAAMTSSPVLFEITADTPKAAIGWTYADGGLHEPA
jgi:hypothetical protein